jgi:hypothetical protein
MSQAGVFVLGSWGIWFRATLSIPLYERAFEFRGCVYRGLGTWAKRVPLAELGAKASCRGDAHRRHGPGEDSDRMRWATGRARDVLDRQSCVCAVSVGAPYREPCWWERERVEDWEVQKGEDSMVVNENGSSSSLIRAHCRFCPRNGDMHGHLASQSQSVRPRDAVARHRDARANAPKHATASGRLRAGGG